MARAAGRLETVSLVLPVCRSHILEIRGSCSSPARSPAARPRPERSCAYTHCQRCGHEQLWSLLRACSQGRLYPRGPCLSPALRISCSTMGQQETCGKGLTRDPPRRFQCSEGEVQRRYVSPRSPAEPVRTPTVCPSVLVLQLDGHAPQEGGKKETPSQFQGT